MILALLVEGILDEHVARRLLRPFRIEISAVYGRKGAAYIRKRATGFNAASKGQPILALVDFMDTGLTCPPEVVECWCPGRRPTMLFRVVVRELESWLLADRAGIARFLGVRQRLVPADPEGTTDPKRALMDLARRSSRRTIRELLVPGPGTSATVGPGYTSELARFIRDHWDPAVAGQWAPSLASCMRAIEGVLGHD